MAKKMKDIYLRSETEENLIKGLPFLRFENKKNNESWRRAGSDFAFDLIGHLHKNDAEYNTDGELTKAPTLIAGFHANLRCTEKFFKQVPNSLVIPTPKNPRREFF
jgi:hypothetical protein